MGGKLWRGADASVIKIAAKPAREAVGGPVANEPPRRVEGAR
jgi:hypothetical protein